MLYSYDAGQAKENIEKSALAILDLLEVTFNGNHQDLVKFLRQNLLGSIYKYETIIEQQMEAYEILRSLKYYAGWTTDDKTLNKEQRKKMKILLDLLEPDEKLSAHVDFHNWMERLNSTSSSKGGNNANG